ncbi:MAG TPA: tRNA epoxyqueuosine(34) reductase QueG [Nannocystis exedens]|nr:tRNA epoxyqueuosine(34) reductase QueG [Nannocystis exedens]
MPRHPPAIEAPILDSNLLALLRLEAEKLGLLRLAAVDLDHPGFIPARATYRHFLDEGKAGSMGFLERTREVRQDPAQMLPGARTLLLVCVPYDGESGPIARYAQSLDYHTVLHGRLLGLQAHLQKIAPGSESLICVDTKPLLERSAAALAGLGFLGKHGCLIVPGLGSYVLLGALMTTAVLDNAPGGIDAKTMKTALWDACGSCRRCLDACPTDAFDSPGHLDPRRCIAYLTIEEREPIDDALAAKLGERIAGCDVCQEVCPYNAGDRQSRTPAVARLDPPPGNPRTIDLLKIAEIGSSRQRALVRGTALRRIPRRHLRRNALLALGNREGQAKGEEAAVLRRGCLDPDPQIAAAASWACTRRGVPLATEHANHANHTSHSEDSSPHT